MKLRPEGALSCEESFLPPLMTVLYDRAWYGVARYGAYAETNGVSLCNFPETVILNDGYGDIIYLRQALEALGSLGTDDSVTTQSLEKYFDSEEKLVY